jgi:hypothetical protein
LLYHLPPDGYEIGAALAADAERLPRLWARVRSTLVARASTRQVPIFIGADHHAAHPAIGHLRSLLAQLEPTSEFRISKLHDFFIAASLEANAVPVISGELRWSYGYTWTLQGVHSTRAALKRRHGVSELSLGRIAEPLAALALARNKGDQRPVLNHAWRRLLQSEFHDSIAGCTSDAVAERVRVRLDDARAMAAEIARTSLDGLIGNDPDRARAEPESSGPQLVLWNPAPRRRRTIVIADLSWFRSDVLVGPPGDRMPRTGPGGRPFHLVSPEGSLPVQPMGRRRGHERLDAPHHYPDQDEVDWTRVAFRAEIGGLGLANLDLGQGTAPLESGVWLKGRTLGNDLVEVRVRPNGALHLWDRRTRQRYPELLTFESSGDVGDTYTYCPPSRDRLRRSSAATTVRPLANGPYVAALELRTRLAAGSRRRGHGVGAIDLRLVVSLHAGSPAVRCTLEIDNHASDYRLRLRAPTGLQRGNPVAGAQFGFIERAPLDRSQRKYPRETPVSTAPAHRYVTRAVKSRGLALLAPGFFEYELDRRGDLLVTLLRAVGQLSRGDLPTRPGHAGWPTETPGAQCQGMERIQLAIAPVTQAQVERGSALPELWEDVFLPVHGVWLRQASPLSLEPFEVRLEGDGLVFSGLKPAEEGSGMVLRCYNATGKPTVGTWHFGAPVSSAQRARADEHSLHEIRLGEAGHIVPFHAAPHEIVTIMVALGPPD